MEIIKREEMWIHTHFTTDVKSMDSKQRQRMQWEMENFLRGLGIVYGIRFEEGETVKIVLECIPVSKPLDEIHKHLEEVVRDVHPKPKVVRVQVTEENDGQR